MHPDPSSQRVISGYLRLSIPHPAASLTGSSIRRTFPVIGPVSTFPNFSSDEDISFGITHPHICIGYHHNTIKACISVYVPPVSDSDGYVDGAQLIKNRELDVQVRTGTTLALEERQFGPGGKAIIAISIYAAIVIVSGIVNRVVDEILGDRDVSSNLMLLVLLSLTVIWHSVVRNSLRQ
jgi:hypothetical protein